MAPSADRCPVQSISRLRSTIPLEYFVPDGKLAFISIAVATLFLGFALFLAVGLWQARAYWLFPVSWCISGMAFTSYFVLGHDCGHFSFVRSRRAMVILGHLFFLPALHPFYSWKYLHDAHHTHANLLTKRDGIYYDNAWNPVTADEYRQRSQGPSLALWIYRLIRACPPVGALIYRLYFQLNLRLYRRDHRAHIRRSFAVLVLAFGAGWAGLVFVTGSVYLSVLHFWLLPALCFDCWLAAYTLAHHVSVDTRRYDDDDWTAYRGQVESTINCYFPRWISFLHFNVDIHVPHHIAPEIPSYWLRKANGALKRSARGAEVNEVAFSIWYLYQQVRLCKLWDVKAQRYVTFAHALSAAGRESAVTGERPDVGEGG